jgi:hypothetical protein
MPTPAGRSAASPGQLHVDHTLVHRGLERSDAVGLYLPGARAVNAGELEQLLVHAARFIAPVRLGGLVAGVPAAWAAEPIASLVRESGDDPPPVWPSATGRVRGQAFEPPNPAAVAAATASPRLAELLAEIDTLRTRDPRLRGVAESALKPLLARVHANARGPERRPARARRVAAR